MCLTARKSPTALKHYDTFPKKLHFYAIQITKMFYISNIRYCPFWLWGQLTTP